jgi:biotin synthase-like enzyme
MDLTRPVFFERAIFLSWYCSRADCTFCYMSTQKERITEPKSARRDYASIFAEAIISKACGWKLEFLSGGYGSFSIDELVFIADGVSRIYGSKLWLNLGGLNRKELALLLPYAEGYIGTVECINPKVHDEVCPSKPLSEVLKSFSYCDEMNLKKGITIIIGLGETIDDFLLLKDFIRLHGIDRITFYSLNPQPGTPFKSSPPIGYYSEWIRKTRDAFSSLHITAGAWHDKTSYFSELIMAGADCITKFPALKMFGSKKALSVEHEVVKAGRKFSGTFSKMPDIDWDSEIERLGFNERLKGKIRKKIGGYLKKIK